MRDQAHRPDDSANAYQSALTDLRGVIRAACTRESGWPNRVAAAVHAALGFAATNPAAARLLTVGVFAGGREGIRLHQQMVERFARLLGAGAPVDPLRSEIAETFMVSCIVSIATERLLAGEERELPALASQLVELTLLPYLGAAEAKELACRYRP